MKLLLKQNVRQQLKATLQEGAQKGKVSGGQKKPSVKKGKGDNGEKLYSNCSVVQAEENANSANARNVGSVSKSESLAKSSVVIASSTEISNANEKGK